MSLTPQQLHILTETVLGEAANQGDKGQAAVVWTILNRANSGGWGSSDPAEIALQNKQFSAWNKGAGGNHLVRTSPNDPRYKAAQKVVQSVIDGAVPDPTGGATYYVNPNGTKWRPPGTQSAKIGGHVFYNDSGAKRPPLNVGQTAQGRQMPLGMGRGQIRSGPDVTKLQQQLAAAGFDPGPADGTFGPKTAAAVRAAETRYGLTVDKGVAGPQVQQALAKLTPMQDVAQTQAMVAPSQAMFHAPWDVPGPDFSIAGPAPGSPMPWEIPSGPGAGISAGGLPPQSLSGSVIAGGGAPGASATMNFVQPDQPLNQWARRGFGGINAGPELVGGNGQPPVNPPAQLSMSQGEAPLGWTAIDSSGNWTPAPMQDITASGIPGASYPDTSGWKQNVPGGLNSLSDLPGVNWLFGGGSPAAAAAPSQSIPPAVSSGVNAYDYAPPWQRNQGPELESNWTGGQTLGYGGNDVMQGNAGGDLQPAGGEPYKPNFNSAGSEMVPVGSDINQPFPFTSLDRIGPDGVSYMQDYQPEGDPSVMFDMAPLALAGLAAQQDQAPVAAPPTSPGVTLGGYGGYGSGYGSRNYAMPSWGNSSNAAQSAGYTTGIASPFYSQIAASHGYSVPADAFTPGSGGAIYAYQSNGQGGGTYVDSHGNVHSY